MTCSDNFKAEHCILKLLIIVTTLIKHAVQSVLNPYKQKNPHFLSHNITLFLSLLDTVAPHIINIYTSSYCP